MFTTERIVCTRTIKEKPGEFQERGREFIIKQCLSSDFTYSYAVADGDPLRENNDLTELDFRAEDAIASIMGNDIREYIAAGKHFMLTIDISYFPYIYSCIDMHERNITEEVNDGTDDKFEKDVRREWHAFNIEGKREKIPTVIVNMFLPHYGLKLLKY